MELSEIFEIAIEKLAKKKDRIIARERQALLIEKESIVVKSYNNGISIPLIVNITNLSTKEVKAILKKKGLI